MKGSNGQGKGEGEGKGGEEKGQKMEKQEQEELKSRRNVAAKQGQRTRQKDCEERQRWGRQEERKEEERREEKTGISATRESECCIYFPPEQGTQLVAAGLSLPSIR